MWPLLYISDFVDHIFAHPAHLAIEVALGLFVIYMIFQKRFKPSKEPKLTEKEIQEIVDDWKPQPLGAPLTSLQRLNIDSSPTITGPPDKYLEVNGKKTLNFGTTNYLGLATDPAVLDAAKKALRKYGCGACGPRGFYGTIDIHLDLEERIAKFMGTEQAIIYSAAFATMASAIPAFAKRDDIIIYDDEINFSLQNGIYLSRSTAIPFKHNNVEDLDRAWAKVVEDDKKFKRPLTRRFLVIEGIYANSGDMAPLDQIMKLKEKYCFRIIIDDSHAIGVYGATGRGTIEHFGININDVEIILSSMGTVMSSAGGYCCGSKTVVSHQRLNSSGYVFSAALPPFLAATSISCLDIIDSSPSLLNKLRSNAILFRQKLGHLDGFQVTGKEDSPLIHIRRLIPSYQKEEDRFPTEVLLQKVVDQVREDGVSICRAKYVAKDMCKAPPSLNIYISTFHEPEDIEKAASSVRRHLLECFKGQ